MIEQFPVSYEQFVQIRRQTEARKQEQHSLQYERLLDDLDASIGEWQRWRHDHPSPGTMVTLVANAHWLTPLCMAAQMVAGPLMLGL